MCETRRPRASAGTSTRRDCDTPTWHAGPRLYREPRTPEGTSSGGAVAHTETDPVGRSALRKVAWRLVPFLRLRYFVNYLDRTNIGFAKLTMSEDLGLTETMFGLASGLFFIGYLFFEVPSNLALHRFGARGPVVGRGHPVRRRAVRPGGLAGDVPRRGPARRAARRRVLVLPDRPPRGRPLAHRRRAELAGPHHRHRG